MAAPTDQHADDARPFRWQAVFQRSTDALFLLNRRRQVLFVNRAWEALTGFTFADVRGQVCRRRPRGILSDRLEVLLSTLAPPQEALRGQSTRVRRLFRGAGWHINFFPLADAAGPLALVGKIEPGPAELPTGYPPLSEKLFALRERQRRLFQLDQLSSTLPAMERVSEQIRLAGQTTLPVLLVGEPGTGKHWTARTIHELGPQRDKPFLRLDCARLPAEMVADLVLGDSDDAAGTFYLEQVDCWPRDLQERLEQRLRGEAEGARLLAGLGTEPRAAIASGQLLERLYLRLSALTIALPPLRERGPDLGWWIARLLERARQACEKEVTAVTPETLQYLSAYRWPGNLAELYDVLYTACQHAKKAQIEAADLPFHLRHAPLPPEKKLPLDTILEQVERRLILQALRLARNNKSRAADLLGIWRPRLLRRLETLGISDTVASEEAKPKEEGEPEEKPAT